MGKSKKVPNYKGPDSEIMDEAYDTIKVVIDEFTDSLIDGVQLKDYIKWYNLARKSYDLGKTVFPDKVTKERVINIARYIYWAINPDWPWIPEFIEKKLEEKLIIETLIPLIVHNAYDAVAGYIEARTIETAKEDGEYAWCKDCGLKSYCPCPPFLKPLCPNRLL